MQKKSSKPENSSHLLMLEIKAKSKSFSPVSRNGWAIKFSVYRNCNILLLFTSLHTGQTIVRYFTEEDDAVKYINFVTSKDPQEELSI
jgi:hypothetical protein